MVLIPWAMGGDQLPVYVLVMFAVLWGAIRLSMILPPYYKARAGSPPHVSHR